MKVGTPGFVGARLTEAREAMGLTQIALADLLDVTRQAVSQYESGDASPSPDVMRRISAKLDLPIRFFLERPRNRARGTTFYRSMKSTTKAARARADRRFGWLLDIADYIRNWIRFPAIKVPDFRPPSDPAAIGSDMIREFALETRRHWGLGLGPISNVAWLLENSGVVVSRYGLGADELDAFSEWVPEDSTPYVVLNSEKRSAARSRFDVGHELGHLILHRNVDRKAVNKPDWFNLIEDQAHRFAGEFLLPQETFAGDYFAPSLDSFATLQAKWKVSIAFMINRFSALGLITPEQRTSLYRNRSRRGWSTREPFDDEMEAENPRLLRRSFEMLIDKSIIDVNRVTFDLIYPAREIETLTGLAHGYLDRSAQSYGMPEIKDRDSDVDVIRFPGAG